MSIDPKNLVGTAVQTFAEEFDTLSLWDGVQGRWCTTYAHVDSLSNGSTLASNGEQEWYINSRFAPTAAVKPWSVAGSILTLTADKAPAALQPLINNYQFTSGQLNTFHSFNQTFGYFEARMLVPFGQGFWPAFWLLPQSMAWPPEIDVMEVLGKDTTKLYTTVHTQQTGVHTSDGKEITVPDMSAGFHLYGVDWEPDFTVFYFDRQEVFRSPTPADMKVPMYMLLDFGVGGFWPGMVDNSTPFPSKMLVDYVHAYRATGAAVAPPPGPPYVAPPPVPVPAPGGSGFIITGDDAVSMQALAGSSGNDIFYPGRRGSIMTGAGGANRYAFKALPWATDRITDFKVGVDRLDFSLLTATQEVQTSLEDATVAGVPATMVRFRDPSWTGGTFAMVVLEKVPLAGLTVAKLFNVPVPVPPPVPVVPPNSVFDTALGLFVDLATGTPAAEKAAALKKQVTRLGG